MLGADAFQGEHLPVRFSTGTKHGWMASGIFSFFFLVLQHNPNSEISLLIKMMNGISDTL